MVAFSIDFSRYKSDGEQKGAATNPLILLIIPPSLDY